MLNHWFWTCAFQMFCLVFVAESKERWSPKSPMSFSLRQKPDVSITSLCAA